MKLHGKVAIVTGAGSGIGRATAQRLAAEGASVLCADIAKAQDTADEITAQGGTATGHTMDVSDWSAWTDAVARVDELYGGVELLANIAGVVARDTDTAIEQTEEDWERILSVNLKGTWFGMRAVLPTMIERGRGSIVNTASEAAILGIPGLLAYTASKGGVAAMTRQVAIEYVKQGVTVNAVAPGFIRTPIQDGIPQNLLDDMAAGIPIGEFGTPDDIAATVAHLLSADARYVTGQLIAVDGGWGVA